MPEQQSLTPNGLQALLDALQARGYRIIGPTLRDQAVVYDDVQSLTDLPVGWTDVQEAGHYRLARRDDDALFGYAVGPHSWKHYLHTPVQRLWHAKHERDDIIVTTEPPEAPRLALFGVRSCELHAIAIQDRVLLGGHYRDVHYAARRQDNFIVAVNCAVAGGTCFCASMHTGPKAVAGYDLALTEIIDEGEHRFLIEAGTPEGVEVLSELPARQASNEDIALADAILASTAESMGREMQADDVRELLLAHLEHPRWDDVATRCLTCGNCTLVCPTCFCTSEEDSSDLTGTEMARSRRWDSCFTMDFSYLHGGSVRASHRARYRQWMTHKLATWHDQFDTSGCVGCGRCITWCPVGIDITEEVKAIRETSQEAGS
ncbi:4Fe-4S dicluster domain-containing protein [Modicisalibacter xianhensis]|uniref:4Fe-4S dicluster domain-containing protein n=1 Tax=Modicisalibacter xianhensis TaxID=442341 RepID=A0A1I2ZYL0_9GAMM|nr:4Fe-4S dicluster domain-containing protein [Halomonas xianhensis]SFH42736.1 4Fe-4S dicluster domain-containing protein [Halomonas xianhensis]